MRRALAIGCAWALLPACLSLGSSPLAAVDETPPTVLRLKPELREPPPDAGAYSIPVAGSIDITFSEEMDPSSLRPGISVRNKGLEIPINIVAAQPTANPSDTDREETVTVSAAGSDGFPVGTLRLVLNNLLIDQQGNPIAFEGDQTEVLYFFFVQ